MREMREGRLPKAQKNSMGFPVQKEIREAPVLLPPVVRLARHYKSCGRQKEKKRREEKRAVNA